MVGVNDSFVVDEEVAMPWFGRRSQPSPEPDSARRPSGGAPTIVAELEDGPLEGRRVDVEAVEGRPPKTVDVGTGDGGTCRYCLAEWTQTGGSAAYTFLYRV
jgi:hypothetical protein